jgi:hypothetical protein
MGGNKTWLFFSCREREREKEERRRRKTPRYLEDVLSFGRVHYFTLSDRE